MFPTKNKKEFRDISRAREKTMKIKRIFTVNEKQVLRLKVKIEVDEVQTILYQSINTKILYIQTLSSNTKVYTK